MTNLTQLFLVFCGGGLGSCCRYLVSLMISTRMGSLFPWGTFTVNVIGCFLIGIVIGLVERYQLSSAVTLFFATGFCGGFTTFSTFAYEHNILLKNNEFELFFVYPLMSIFFGLGAMFLSVLVIKLF